MTNPWLEIPLADYEGHMALAQVDQARLLADVFDAMLKEYRPRSLAVVGCAGGNGFDRIDGSVTTRVVAVDINPAYIDQLRARFAGHISDLELMVGDIQSDGVGFAPVDFVFAALVLEYVDVKRVLERVRSLLGEGGILGTVIQLPGPMSVTPSPFESLEALSPIMRLVPPEQLVRLAGQTGYEKMTRRREESVGGKHFEVQVFRKHAPQERRLP